MLPNSEDEDIELTPKKRDNKNLIINSSQEDCQNNKNDSYKKGKLAFRMFSLTKDKTKIAEMLDHFSIAKKIYKNELQINPNDQKITERLDKIKLGGYFDQEVTKISNSISL